jgi:hypothetical protein
MTTSSKNCYAVYRFPLELISHTVLVCFRFPLSRNVVPLIALPDEAYILSVSGIHDYPSDLVYLLARVKLRAHPAGQKSILSYIRSDRTDPER